MGEAGVKREQASDAAEVHRSSAYLRAASEAAQHFAASPFDVALDAAARLLCACIGDACAVFLDEPGPEPPRLAALQATDPALSARFREALTGADAVHPAALRGVLETGEARLVTELPTSPAPEPLDATEVPGELSGYLLVALRAPDRNLGVLALGRFRPGLPAYDDRERELAQIVAEQASLALQRAQLSAAAEGARRAAQQAEERAGKAEEMQRFVFESSPIPKMIFEVEGGRLLAANAAALELYGYDEDEFLTLVVDDLRLPEERGKLNAALKAAGASASLGTGHHRRRDGSVIFLEGRHHQITYEGHKARFVVLQDQTERVTAEAARRESEGRLQRTLDMMMEGYTILGPDLRYLYVNDVGVRHAQLPRETLLGRTPMELYPNFESTGMYGLLMRCLRERTPIRMEEELTLADGKKAYFEVNLRPTLEGGLVILSIDVTERRRTEEAREALEEQLRQSQRMDAVGRLAGGVAHDFNNILSIILGYGETLLEDLAPEDPKRADVLEIHRAAERAAELTKQLLLFSRQQLVTPKVLDLNDVIGGMQKMLHRLLGEHIELVCMLDADLGRIKADRGNIEQVIMNLAVNARDAMPKGGKLTVETANVALDEAFARGHLGAEPGPYVLLAVTDTGLGMEKATRLRIFEPFFTTKGQGKGTGLGLSTVFGIVQQSRGGIWVYSEPGQGSTFKVYLPRTDAVAEPERSGSPPSQGGSETILLVEDEEAVRVVARRMLERNGYRVLVARDPADAVRLSEELGAQIDLLMTDVVMPRMSGAALAARLCARWPGMKVLYVSGYTDGTVGAHGVLETGVAFLQKPFTSEQLASKIRNVLGEPALAGQAGASVA